MIKVLPTKWIRKAVYDLVNNIVVDGVTVPCFDTNVIGETRPDHYILMSTQSNEVEKSNKCEYFWDSDILLDINSIYESNGGYASRLLNDNITEKVRELTHDIQLDPSSGLEIITRTQSFPNSLSANTGNQIIFRNFIRITLIIK